MRSGRGRGNMVLYVIDDDASVRDGLCRLAISAGFEARPFMSIGEFAQQPTRSRKGCMLLDADQLQLEPHKPMSPRRWQDELPVIVLCGSDDVAARHAARSFGARFFLNKPVDAQALFDAIAWVTEGPG